MLAAFTWNLDPVLIDFGRLQIRWYGVIFMTTLAVGYALWRWQCRRGGHDGAFIERFLIWGVAATLVGARLGHVLFYNADYYLQNPSEILAFWRGGLASHGAMIGLLIATAVFARIHRMSVLQVMDRLSFSAAGGAAGIRLGNFLNSEIVGRPTDVPWAVVFERHDLIPRHPSQLYEFAMGLAVLALLVAVDRSSGREKRPRGLLTGAFLLAYGLGRFGVEFFKEYHIDELRGGLTMGQYLSIAPIAAGAVLVVLAALGVFGRTAPPATVDEGAEPSTRVGRSRRHGRPASSRRRR